ncbi:MAG: hypothetical protein ABI298_03125 [Acidimicrobiales bacterium]
MNTVVLRVRERSKGHITFMMVLWAVIVAVVLFMLEARYGSRASVLWSGFGATALFGIYLGVRRRVGAIFVAPLVSWLVAWFPLIVASMIHDGFFKGLGVGILLISLGWFVIGFVEFATLFVMVTCVRMFGVTSAPRNSDVMVFGPGDGQSNR